MLPRSHRTTRLVRLFRHPSLARGGWGLGGQVLNSVSNVALSVMVARMSSPTAFGAFSLGFAAYMLFLGLVRAIASTPLLIAENGDDESRLGAAASGAVSVTLWLGALVAAVLLGAAFALEGVLGTVAVSFAVVIPCALLQDTARYIYFARRQPRAASFLDLVWIAIQGAGFGLVVLQGYAGSLAPTLAWGFGAGMAGLAGVVNQRCRPTIRAGVRFVHRHRPLFPALSSDYVATVGVAQLVPYIVAAISGLTATAGLRAGAVLLGGYNVVALGLQPMAMVEVARLRESGTRPLSTFFLLWSVVLAGLALTYGAILLALPDAVGDALLGPSWYLAQPLLIPLILKSALIAPFNGAQIVLRGTLRMKEALSLRITSSMTMLLLPTVGAYLAGAEGAAYGIAASALVASFHSVSELSRKLSNSASSVLCPRNPS